MCKYFHRFDIFEFLTKIQKVTNFLAVSSIQNVHQGVFLQGTQVGGQPRIPKCHLLGTCHPYLFRNRNFYSFFQTSEEVFSNSKKCSDELYIEDFFIKFCPSRQAQNPKRQDCPNSQSCEVSHWGTGPTHSP